MSKQDQIKQFIDNNVGNEYRTADLAEHVGCSLPTILSFIKNNAHRFEKTGHGKYFIKTEAKTMTVSESSISDSEHEIDSVVHEEMTTVSDVVALPVYQPSTPRPTFDW